MVQLHLWLTCGCLFYVLCIKLQVKGSVCSTDLWYPCRVPLIILLSIKMKWLRINQIAYYIRPSLTNVIRMYLIIKDYIIFDYSNKSCFLSKIYWPLNDNGSMDTFWAYWTLDGKTSKLYQIFFHVSFITFT